MQHLLRSWLLAGAAALALNGWALAQGTAAQPQAAAAVLQPAKGVALPQPDDTNAQRAISQPGNNAPVWRDVRNSGNQPGVIALPAPSKAC